MSLVWAEDDDPDECSHLSVARALNGFLGALMPVHALLTTYPRNLASRKATSWCNQAGRAPSFVRKSLFS